jgi:uncharacterized membrane protein
MNIVHVHLLLNHVPVVGAVLGAALLVYALIRRNSEVAKLSLALFAALAVVAVAVFFTGEPAEEAIEQLPGFSNTITEQHEELALASTIALGSFGVVALAALAYYRRKLLPRWATATGLAISLTIGGLLAATANLGGQIRHSEIRPGANLGNADSDAARAEERHR